MFLEQLARRLGNGQAGCGARDVWQSYLRRAIKSLIAFRGQQGQRD